MKVNCIEQLKGCLKIPIIRHVDDRGFFKETWNQHEFNKTVGKNIQFVQDNNSLSHRHVLRGLHFQYLNPQGKLVRVDYGSILDVVVDLRQSSETFKCWSSIKIASTSNFQLWIPIGFAHGFISLEDNTLIAYKTTDFWAKDYEQTLIWNDPDLGIEWPTGVNPIISKKDRAGLPLSKMRYFD